MSPTAGQSPVPFLLTHCSFRVLIRLVRQNRIELRYLPRLLFIVLTSVLVAPSNLIERLLYSRRIEATPLHSEPIFILGHQRSGTTMLHELLAAPKGHGAITMAQMTAPHSAVVDRFLPHPIRNLVRPTERPMDNMKLNWESPQEEGYIIAKSTIHSAHTFMAFPKRSRDYFKRYVLMEDLSDQDRSEWKKIYKSILKKTQFLVGNQTRLVLKDPFNTARIKILLEIYPDAKFVYIHRNPYDVFASKKHLDQVMYEWNQLQSVSEEDQEAIVLDFYRQLIERYLELRELIPRKNLVELAFEDLERDPLTELGKIYNSLGLSGFDDAKGVFEEYIEDRSGYEKNPYELSDLEKKKVDDKWGSLFAPFGYEKLGA